MDNYLQVFENNKVWVETKLNQDKDFFKKLSKEQHPEFLYIGCADSRVPANEIMGLEPGDVFVHRNIANLVIHTDLNCQSVIEYAVVHLKVKHIVICGHYGCGGVNAAMQSADLGILNPWLRHIRDTYRKHQIELNDISADHIRFNRLVELNVLEQCMNVAKTASVQRQYHESDYPKVHGWVYDLKNGLLKDLKFDFEHQLHKIEEIYNLGGGKNA